jgi:hypothetical protein
MQWLIAVMRFTEGRVSLLIQTEDERLYPLTVASMDPGVIRAAIAGQFHIPLSRVVYDSTRQTLYRRLTYMRFMVME